MGRVDVDAPIDLEAGRLDSGRHEWLVLETPTRHLGIAVVVENEGTQPDHAGGEYGRSREADEPHKGRLNEGEVLEGEGDLAVLALIGQLRPVDPVGRGRQHQDPILAGRVAEGGFVEGHHHRLGRLGVTCADLPGPGQADLRRLAALRVDDVEARQGR